MKKALYILQNEDLRRVEVTERLMDYAVIVCSPDIDVETVRTLTDDAKLLAATAVWFGPTPMLLEYILFASIYGGLLTIGLLTIRAFLQPVTGVAFIDRLLERETGIPYGIALGLAGLTVYSGSVWIDIAARSAPF